MPNSTEQYYKLVCESLTKLQNEGGKALPRPGDEYPNAQAIYDRAALGVAQQTIFNRNRSGTWVGYATQFTIVDPVTGDAYRHSPAKDADARVVAMAAAVKKVYENLKKGHATSADDLVVDVEKHGKENLGKFNDQLRDMVGGSRMLPQIEADFAAKAKGNDGKPLIKSTPTVYDNESVARAIATLRSQAMVMADASSTEQGEIIGPNEKKNLEKQMQDVITKLGSRKTLTGEALEDLQEAFKSLSKGKVKSNDAVLGDEMSKLNAVLAKSGAVVKSNNR